MSNEVEVTVSLTEKLLGRFGNPRALRENESISGRLISSGWQKVGTSAISAYNNQDHYEHPSHPDHRITHKVVDGRHTWEHHGPNGKVADGTPSSLGSHLLRIQGNMA